MITQCNITCQEHYSYWTLEKPLIQLNIIAYYQRSTTFGCGNNFCKWIKIIYKIANVSVKNNGYIGNIFNMLHEGPGVQHAT